MITGILALLATTAAITASIAGEDPYSIGEIVYVWPDGGHIARIRSDADFAIERASLDASMEPDFDHEIVLVYRDWYGTKLVLLLLRLSGGVALLGVRGPPEGEIEAQAEDRLAAFFSAMTEVVDVINIPSPDAFPRELSGSRSGQRQLTEGRWVALPERAVG